MQNKPLISIIIPVYNRQELVKETLDSVLDQTYQNWECIVVDDGSTDDTWKVLESYAKKNTRIKIHKRHRAPKGAPTCRNIGIDNSTSEYIMFLDSDDLLASWSLETRICYLNKNSNLDVLLSQSFEFDNKDLNNRKIRSSYGDKNIKEEFLNYEIPFGTPNPTWRKSFLIKENIKWYEGLAMMQDVIFHINAFSKMPDFEWAEEVPDVFIRVEKGFRKISNSNELQKTLSRLNIIKNIQYITDNKKYKTKFIIDTINKLEYLQPLELDQVLRKHSNMIKDELGVKNYFYLLLYHNLRKIKYFHGLIYRLRPLMTFNSRNNILKKRPYINDDLFNQLKRRYQEYPINTISIKSLENQKNRLK